MEADCYIFNKKNRVYSITDYVTPICDECTYVALQNIPFSKFCVLMASIE